METERQKRRYEAGTDTHCAYCEQRIQPDTDYDAPRVVTWYPELYGWMCDECLSDPEANPENL